MGERDAKDRGEPAELVEAAGRVPEQMPERVPEVGDLREGDDDLPVVARLIVEIRSDGSRTIARGAIEDSKLGQRVAVEARGDSPLALALALARSIGSMTRLGSSPAGGGERPRLPRLSARAALRGLLDRRKK
jgi:hypothetical protein